MKNYQLIDEKGTEIGFDNIEDIVEISDRFQPNQMPAEKNLILTINNIDSDHSFSEYISDEIKEQMNSIKSNPLLNIPEKDFDKLNFEYKIDFKKIFLSKVGNLEIYKTF